MEKLAIERGNNKLNFLIWFPKGEIKGIIQIAHGVTEHMGRYSELAEFMNSKGFIVCGHDHRGHGETVGTPLMSLGQEGSWFEACEDIYACQQKIKDRYPEVPYILLGFSMGSFMVRTLMTKRPYMADAYILVGTGHQGKLALKLAEFIARKEASKFGYYTCTEVIDGLTFGTYNQKFKPVSSKFDWLCENKSEREKYLADSKRGDSMTVGLFLEMLSGMEFTADKNNISKIAKTLPILFVSGDNDPVGEFGKGIKLAEKAYKKAGINVTCKLFPGRHDIFHETCHEDVFKYILSWILDNVR